VSTPPEVRAARAHRERASAGWSWETNSKRRAKVTAEVLEVWGGNCHLCGRDGADTADHIVPRSAGGPHTLDNLRPAHQACNQARGDMPLARWHLRRVRPRRAPLAPSREW
jgi:5-methylcytosine-specific restriction endonuclease McrA